MVFSSKVDAWLLLTLVACCLVPVVMAYSMSKGFPRDIWGLLPIVIVVVANVIIVCVLYGYRYTVRGDRLTISVLGMKTGDVPIRSITSLASTHNPLSSPAASIDRILIRYGRYDSVMVSPRDKAGLPVR